MQLEPVHGPCPQTLLTTCCHITTSRPPQGCEHYTYSKGRFNIVLAGAAFMDSHLVFPAYYSDRNKEVRASSRQREQGTLIQVATLPIT